jgi:hypothetical protein
VGAFISRGLLENTTMTLSTLIGPAEKILFCGHPVVFLAPSVYGIPQVSHLWGNSLWLMGVDAPVKT